MKPNGIEDDVAILERPVNVSKVRQLSPFRYPGGKTWLVPQIRKWICSLDFRPDVFVEPFAGGGIASLTVAIENLADKVYMAELDPDVASVWQTIFNAPDYLCKRILRFKVNLENVKRVINTKPKTLEQRAFRTIVKNRTQRGGILAPGASLIKSGENGKGLKSRWYPETLVKRITLIHELRHKITFASEDGFDSISRYKQRVKAAFFIDPPYTAGGKRAGNRLYFLNQIDHLKLFDMMTKIHGVFLMTYDDSQEVIELAESHDFVWNKVPMKNTHHAINFELLIKKT